MDFEQFYSTPPELARELVHLLEHRHGGLTLEPSAGNGDLITTFIHLNNSGRFSNYSTQDLEGTHCIEINPQRAAILKEKGFKVIWDDFLTFQPFVRYGQIIMNPPFREGCRHLLKALSICVDGCEIACILNAETIKNPFSNERKQLIKELEAQEKFTVTYKQEAFVDAERQTDVEVALVYVRKKATEIGCNILNKFQKAFVAQREQTSQNSLTRYGEIESLIDRHDAEVSAAIALYDEIDAYNQLALKDKDDHLDNGLFKIEINKVEGYGYTDQNRQIATEAIVRRINYKYWKQFFVSKTIAKIVTSDVLKKYREKLFEFADYDFNERNAFLLREELLKNLFSNINDAILKVFYIFTQDYSCEKKENVHYYSGWKTNKAFYVNKKIVIPLYAFDNWSRNNYSFRSTNVRDKIEDFERVFNHLDSGRTEELSLYEQLEKAQEKHQYKNVDTKYFVIDFFKKGTAHFKFKDLELLKKFNIYVGRQKQWLPPSYGQKSYDAMNDEEKAVIDSFEGKEEYEKTFYNRDFYLNSGDNVLMLGAGKNE